MDEGKVRSVGVRTKKEAWIPSKDETAHYFHVSKSTYIRGSAALVKQQLRNDRAKAAEQRPMSATGERSNWRRSSSPALKRPSSASSMRSGGRQSAAWWSRNSWDNLPLFSSTKMNTYKRRLLDDIMQEANNVRVDISDARKFGAGADDYKWTEVEVINAKPKSKSKAKKLVAKKKKLKMRERQPRLDARPTSAPPGRRSAQADQPAASESQNWNVDMRIAHEQNTDCRSSMRPSDISLQPQRLQTLHTSNIRAVMERSSSTLRHIQALKKRQLTDEEVRDMVTRYSPQAPGHSQEKFTHDDYEASLAADLELESPCSLNSEVDDEEETQDTFDFTEGEEETTLSGSYYKNTIDQDTFRSDTSDGWSDGAGVREGGGRETAPTTPKDAAAFMPSRTVGKTGRRTAIDERWDNTDATEEAGKASGPMCGDRILFEGSDALNRTSSSVSSAESHHRRGTEEDSRVPYGPPSGATDPAAGEEICIGGEGRSQRLRLVSPSQDTSHSGPDASGHEAYRLDQQTAVSREQPQGHTVNDRQLPTEHRPLSGPKSSKGSTGAGKQQTWPAAAAGLFSKVNSSSCLL